MRARTQGAQEEQSLMGCFRGSSFTSGWPDCGSFLLPLDASLHCLNFCNGHESILSSENGETNKDFKGGIHVNDYISLDSSEFYLSVAPHLQMGKWRLRR